MQDESYPHDPRLDAMMGGGAVNLGDVQGNGPVVATGLSWAEPVYDYIFSEGMTPHAVEGFIKDSAEASLMELIRIKAEKL